jgi:thiopurine S-methyltransferase
MADRDYWIGRWARGETGWHQDSVEPALVAAFTALPPTRVFVPLCGKSLDLHWLVSRGHEVIGVELSELGCRAAFEEKGLVPAVRHEGAFKIFESGALRILQGDLFDLDPKQLPELGALYDRAALIALPETLRSRYAGLIRQIIAARASAGFRFLQVALERTPADGQGPPYSVGESEIRRLYGEQLRIVPRSRERTELPSPTGAVTDECVYELTELTPAERA